MKKKTTPLVYFEIHNAIENQNLQYEIKIRKIISNYILKKLKYIFPRLYVLFTFKQ